MVVAGDRERNGEIIKFLSDADNVSGAGVKSTFDSC